MLSIDLANFMPSIWNTANTVINGLFQAYTIPIALGLGLGVLGLIVKAFKGVISI
jgi:hypothetical protein